MNFNDPMAQMRRQQEQMRRQQEQLQRQQQDLQRKMAWQAEQNKQKKRNRRQADLLQVDNLQSGGVNITDVDHLGVRGDIVGRDKVSKVNATYPRDEKSGFALFIEQVFAFIFTLLVAGMVFGGIGILIASSVEDESVLIIAGVLALVVAYISASSVSRYRD